MIILYISVAILGLLLLINMLLTWRIGRHSSGDAFNEIKVILGNILSNVKDTEKNLKDEFVINRKENAETATGLRTEMGLQLNNFTQAFTQQLAHLSKTNEEKLEAIRTTFEETALVPFRDLKEFPRFLS